MFLKRDECMRERMIECAFLWIALEWDDFPWHYLTIADGRLQVGADVWVQLDMAADFFGHESCCLPMHGRCLVHPSRCHVMCSICCNMWACSLHNSWPWLSNSFKYRFLFESYWKIDCDLLLRNHDLWNRISV